MKKYQKIASLTFNGFLLSSLNILISLGILIEPLSLVYLLDNQVVSFIYIIGARAR